MCACRGTFRFRFSFFPAGLSVFVFPKRFFRFSDYMQRVKSQVTYLQYITDTRSGQKIIVPDGQMQRFIAVSGTYDDHLLYFQPDELNLSKGTKVRITGGEFEGQEGVFLKVKGARDRRVVIEIQGVIAVAMATIHPDLIEVIG